VTIVPESNSLKEERFILAQRVRGFSTWSAGSIVFNPVVKQKYDGRRE
jgi:hypothetical protein